MSYSSERIRWEYETPRRRETIRYGYVDDILQFKITAFGVGGPWLITSEDGSEWPKAYINPGLAKVEAEAHVAKLEGNR